MIIEPAIVPLNVNIVGSAATAGWSFSLSCPLTRASLLSVVDLENLSECHLACRMISEGHELCILPCDVPNAGQSESHVADFRVVNPPSAKRLRGSFHMSTTIHSIFETKRRLSNHGNNATEPLILCSHSRRPANARKLLGKCSNL